MYTELTSRRFGTAGPDCDGDMRERLIARVWLLFFLSFFPSCSGPIFVIESWVRLTLSLYPTRVACYESLIYLAVERVERALDRMIHVFTTTTIKT